MEKYHYNKSVVYIGEYTSEWLYLSHRIFIITIPLAKVVLTKILQYYINIDVVSPPASASPATGSSKMSTARQRAVIEAAIGITIEA